MPDICDLILEQHTTFRERFADLDGMRADGADVETLRATWEPLAALLETHAVAEEELFYPRLLELGDEPMEETEDAISDHNEITDAVERSKDLEVGSDDWWEAVIDAREENSSHTAEEERGALADFRLNAPEELRLEIGAAWLAFHQEHGGVDREEKDFVDYVEDKAGEDAAEEAEEFVESESD